MEQKGRKKTRRIRRIRGMERVQMKKKVLFLFIAVL
jgi:hypothetical protein